ncbi:DUF397 domain-containing protein [Nocardiopsis changdeensis]|uniref:DUF397 domain-containing protein n=1 Tax=Nocardiopsis changdeensis TaxID=2831969 RepID=A0ABX8BQ93_9ACTN|nr:MULTISPECIES: DUF397 domain-containing protein [Nocardiopsis]QUX23242.1 DUF397 domain-containing protein [Nocardiopsis changdeensis]QYX39184.1 DUF397 domain-containing protein [Nocardiopsis sp. MT53]
MNEIWKKSPYSPNSGNCVECRWTAEAVEARDTKNREAGQLSFGPSEWLAALAAEK